MSEIIEDSRIRVAMQRYVDRGDLAGVVTGVFRQGRPLQQCSVGWSGAEKAEVLRSDALFRIASMTKPITSAVALMLLQERRFALHDPITHWAPEFSEMRVLRSPDGDLSDTCDAERPITFHDLLTHCAGFTYGPFHQGPIAQAYEALGADIDSSLSPDEWIAALASLPLVHQPGATLHYGHATDLLGLLLARMEGAPLAEVLARRLFEPLRMEDTGFTVPSSKHHRRAGLVGFGPAGELTPLNTCPGGSTLASRPDNMTFFSGGQGLWSTLADYARFARIFTEGGNVDGAPLLRPDTLRSMMSNQLTSQQRTCSSVGGIPLFATGHGFGLGLAVVMEPNHCLPTVCKGAVGSVGWPGGFGSWWQADPSNGTIMIFLCHNLVEREQFRQGVGMGVYRAIAEFHALGEAYA
jgi:CubicO group peptidase (beta-lactamase class C family)